MSLQGRRTSPRASILNLAKELSGRRIEQNRKRQRVTQTQLAGDTGIGVRWLREIEGGNPKSRIDDHLICASRLGISSGQIVIPMLIMEHDMAYPYRLLQGDMVALERRCIEAISDYNVETFASHLRLAGRAACRNF